MSTFSSIRFCNLPSAFTLRRGPASVAATSAAANIKNRVSCLPKACHRAGFLTCFRRRDPATSRGSSTMTKSFFKGTDMAPAEAPPGKTLATFAGGCFWGLELAFQRVAGVEDTAVGYTQGKVNNPSYQLVCTGMTGHTEGVQVVYDPKEVTYEDLMAVFFDKTDPTALNRQGNDVGTQYRSGIYFHTKEQEEAALKAVQKIQQQLDEGSFRAVVGNKVVVEVLPAADFYIAEEYHQQYLEKGGRNGWPQSAAKGCKDSIRCYG